MKFIVTSIGTRGDMEPFLAIGEILKNRGHEVTCLFPEQFRTLAEDTGLDFASLGSEFIELLECPAGKIAMGGGGFSLKKLKAYIQLVSKQQAINKQMILRQEEVIEQLNVDRIIHNGKVIYPVLWGMDHPHQTTLLSPVPYLHYVKGHTHLAFHSNYGTFLNKLTYKIANFGLLKTISGSVKWLKTKNNIPQKDIQAALFGKQTIYTISPSLFPRPTYWEPRLKVLGYYERTKTNHWEASTELKAFLNRHKKPIFITFGSMINTAPEKNTALILEILERHQIPAIINTASGGLVPPNNYNTEYIHFVSQIPYDWIFPKVYAVVHHGGSGTTHTAIKYGCANLIIPHIIDQYVWNQLIHEKALGPFGIDVSKLKTKKLEPILLDVYNNPHYKTNAEALGQQMQNENLEDELVQVLVGGEN